MNESKEQSINNQNTNNSNTKYSTFSDFDLGPNYKPIYDLSHLQNINNVSHINMFEKLTPNELQTFKLIINAIKSDHFPKQNTKHIIVRCAGGWVRDKLLNINSDDIDLCIDFMTGEEFAFALQKYLQIMPEMKANANARKLISKIGSIKSNPSQSKHLACATFKLNSIDFDVVQLRTEIYENEMSRCPSNIKYGTVEEDCIRRDLTFNSLYYNINDNVIEDYTGRGFEDLKNGLARTPLPTIKTFTDDPLRILRNIRHTITKFGFILHDDIIQVAQYPMIRNMMRNKITHERFAVEFEKIIKGFNVWIAFQFLLVFGIFPIIFEYSTMEMVEKYSINIPEDFDNENVWEMCVKLVRKMNEMIKKYYGGKCCKSDVNMDIKLLIGNSELQKEMLFSAFLYPFHALTFKDKKKKRSSIVDYFLKFAMPGMPNAHRLGVKTKMYHSSVNLFLQLMNDLKNSGQSLQLKIGEFLCCAKNDWKNVLLLVRAVSSANEDVINDMVSYIETKTGLVSDVDVDCCWNWKPMLNGQQLIDEYSSFGLRKGKQIGMLTQMLRRWRIENPNITLAEMDEKIKAWLSNQ